MAVNTQVTTLADLRTDFINRVRDATGVTGINNMVDRYLNMALHDIHVNPGTTFPWQVRRDRILTHATYTTGTIAVAAATRTTVTGTSTLWATAVTGLGYNNARAGGKILLGSNNEIYTVSTVDSDTQITIAETYAGAAIAAGTSYTYYEDEYALASDFWRPVDYRNFSTDLNVPLIGAREFRRRYTRNNNFAKPRVATVIQLVFATNTTPRYRVVFHPAPDQAYSIPYQYITTNLAVSTAGAEKAQMTVDTDEPIVPLRYRHVIIYGALYHWYRDRKDDVRAPAVKSEYVELLQRIAKDIGTFPEDRPRIQPRSSIWRAPLRRGRYDVGNRFDELRW